MGWEGKEWKVPFVRDFGSWSFHVEGIGRELGSNSAIFGELSFPVSRCSNFVVSCLYENVVSLCVSLECICVLLLDFSMSLVIVHHGRAPHGRV